MSGMEILMAVAACTNAASMLTTVVVDVGARYRRRRARLAAERGTGAVQDPDATDTEIAMLTTALEQGSRDIKQRRELLEMQFNLAQRWTLSECASSSSGCWAEWQEILTAKTVLIRDELMEARVSMLVNERFLRLVRESDLDVPNPKKVRVDIEEALFKANYALHKLQMKMAATTNLPVFGGPSDPQQLGHKTEHHPVQWRKAPVRTSSQHSLYLRRKRDLFRRASRAQETSPPPYSPEPPPYRQLVLLPPPVRPVAPCVRQASPGRGSHENSVAAPSHRCRRQLKDVLVPPSPRLSDTASLRQPSLHNTSSLQRQSFFSQIGRRGSPSVASIRASTGLPDKITSMKSSSRQGLITSEPNTYNLRRHLRSSRPPSVRSRISRETARVKRPPSVDFAARRDAIRSHIVNDQQLPTLANMIADSLRDSLFQFRESSDNPTPRIETVGTTPSLTSMSSADSGEMDRGGTVTSTVDVVPIISPQLLLQDTQSQAEALAFDEDKIRFIQKLLNEKSKQQADAREYVARTSLAKKLMPGAAISPALSAVGMGR